MKQDWKILTSGPCYGFTGTVEEAMAYVEGHTPMKRGWTRQWTVSPDGWRCHRYNSKGALLGSYSVYLGPKSVV